MTGNVVGKLKRALVSGAIIHPDRMVWVLTVHADVMERGSLIASPKLHHVYSMITDAETNTVTDWYFGNDAVRF